MAKGKKLNVIKGVKENSIDSAVKLNNESTIINAVAFPNKEEKITGNCQFLINGKQQVYSAFKTVKLDYKSLTGLNELIGKLFCELSNNFACSIARLTVCNKYGLCFGYIGLSDSGYKCYIAHHKADGDNAVCFNQTGSFLYDHIVNTLKKHSVTIVRGKSGKAAWGIVRLTDSNYLSVKQAIIELLALTPVVKVQA